MIQVVNLRCRSFSVDYNEVFWEIKDTSEDIFDYDFQVLRSEAIAGPFWPVSIKFQDQYKFRDTNIPKGNSIRSLFYVLRVIHRETERATDYGPISVSADDELAGAEIKRHLNILFQEFSGRKCWLFPIRTFGQRCPSCWDSVLHKRKKSGCRACFDTGFSKGYHNPVELWAQIESGTPKAEQNTNVGAMHLGNTTARLTESSIKPRDILVEGENIRWRVTSVGTTELGRAPILVEVQLFRLPVHDIEYALPIPSGDPQTLELSPPRNFTNPHNKSHLQSMTERVFRVYAPGDPYER